MSFETWLLFAGASLVLGLIPGPGVTTIVGHALTRGRAAALAAVAGAALGNAMSMSLSLAGVGALLSASAAAFTVLKWLGSAYLIGLGLFSIRATFNEAEAPKPASSSTSFWGTFVVTLLNPKTLIFFVAFVPQFISPRAALAPQAMLLVATLTIIIFATDAAYALLASGAAHIVRRPRFQVWAKRVGGGALVGAGIATASLRAH
jgi:threonine/homoserine/homoserine lactone efflux protein